MISKISSKYQVTIPREVRSALKLEIADSLEWTLRDGKAVVQSAAKSFLRYRAMVKAGPGNIAEDICRARMIRAQKVR
ncbi:MAG: AbrB/MazE/SpoVT family DNA-binding domain-containing protein [Acidobacteriota bacterium]|jgi:bifunctional DNA-binding transcriptional regulator/antitoxin component of YhaV-PrlF toxin-antitoxin module